MMTMMLTMMLIGGGDGDDDDEDDGYVDEDGAELSIALHLFTDIGKGLAARDRVLVIRSYHGIAIRSTLPGVEPRTIAVDGQRP